MRDGAAGRYKLRDHVQEKNWRFWPTATAGDAKSAAGTTLTDPVKLFQSPMPSDVDGGRTTKGKDRQDETGIQGQVGGQLNPNFVEWLMNYPKDWTEIPGETVSGQASLESPRVCPTGWTDSEPSGTPSSPR